MMKPVQCGARDENACKVKRRTSPHLTQGICGRQHCFQPPKSAEPLMVLDLIRQPAVAVQTTASSLISSWRTRTWHDAVEDGAVIVAFHAQADKVPAGAGTFFAPQLNLHVALARHQHHLAERIRNRVSQESGKGKRRVRWHERFHQLVADRARQRPASKRCCSFCTASLGHGHRLERGA